MSDAYVQVQPDSTGKKVRTGEVTDGNGNTVEQQVVQLADSTGAEVTVTQGATGTSKSMVLAGALVNDDPPSYNVDEARPLSMTTDGRLRVSLSDIFRDMSFFSKTESAKWDNIEATFKVGSPW
jgi:hypothetical protein